MKKIMVFAVLPVLLTAALVTVWAAPVATPADDEKLAIITRLTASMFENQHYRQTPFNPEISAQIFDEYFKALDPNKLYFTAEDVREFEPQRGLLTSQLRKGDTAFAFTVYERFMKRFEEFQKFAEKELQKKYDFTADESFEPDRRKLPRAANDAELHQLWRAKLKSDVLNFRLLKRSLDADAARLAAKEQKAAAAKAAEPKADGARDAATKPEAAAKSAATDNPQAIRALWERRSPEEKVQRRLHDLANFYQQREKIDILGMYLGALAAVYGPHSGYQPPKMDEDFEINMRLSLTGIGATLMSDDGYIRVVDIVPGGPAALDGRLHPEDRIIAVAQESGEPVDVIDMSVDNAVKLIRGPAGTKVTLSVLPGKKGRNAVPENYTLTRGKVELKDSEAQGEVRSIKRPDGTIMKIGVIDLPSFYMDFAAAFRGDPDFKSCTRDIEKLLEKFKAEKVDAVVMDLRNNSGGSLPEAITLTGLFIKTGPVVQVRQANRSTEVEADSDPKVAWDGPLVVMTNKLSASAAEIFAGAIKDYHRGILIGDTRTFGKGTVLTVKPIEQLLSFVNRRFPAGSVRLENAMFFRINGSSVQQLGVQPDIVLPSLTEELEVGEMFSDNHLPWDSITEQSYRLWDPGMDNRLAALRKQSEKRIEASPEYRKVIKRIERIRKQLAKKTVSLNEEKRWREYLDEKELQDSDPDSEDTISFRRRGQGGVTDDPLLDEAAQIAGDYVDMLRPTAASRK